MRTLGIDPGAKNIGVAISDSSGTIANPMRVVKHISRQVDAASIAEIAVGNDVNKIVIGQSLDQEGRPTFSGRQASRLAAALRKNLDVDIILWDESGSTQKASSAQRKLNTGREKKNKHVDEIAAVVILQSYLDSINDLPPSTKNP